jgi:hypothetical protein
MGELYPDKKLKTVKTISESPDGEPYGFSTFSTKATMADVKNYSDFKTNIPEDSKIIPSSEPVDLGLRWASHVTHAVADSYKLLTLQEIKSTHLSVPVVAAIIKGIEDMETQ